MQGYTLKIRFRCRTSTFREVCNVLVRRFGEPFVERLRLLQIGQFLRVPQMPQNVPLIYMLLSKWDIKTESFITKGQSLQFTSDGVALLIGMPNRGIIFDIDSARSAGKTSNDIRHDIERMDNTTPMDDINRTVIRNVNLIFVPIINGKHWTLLVCNLRKK
ncbi:hypothetical protein MA16_Dca028125 [Dendrobium catenatum]|uniref:Ubiquitin-like protease family profile domain-containing protein n=1 Tax=Dendrobium catenatum TaxID=906689 RepID=A0A2I0V803_9ASPA|nr:hypothetical protein MA16_Dca028125 [Dendrobium catenatum]